MELFKKIFLLTSVVSMCGCSSKIIYVWTLKDMIGLAGLVLTIVGFGSYFCFAWISDLLKKRKENRLLVKYDRYDHEKPKAYRHKIFRDKIAEYDKVMGMFYIKNVNYKDGTQMPFKESYFEDNENWEPIV